MSKNFLDLCLLYSTFPLAYSKFLPLLRRPTALPAFLCLALCLCDYPAAVIGVRLHWLVSLTCIIMSFYLLLLK